MKKVLTLLLTSTLFITACGSNGNENSVADEPISEDAALAAEGFYEEKFLLREKLNEQFGGESLEIPYDYDTSNDYSDISEKDGYTYIMSGSEDAILISIVKDNKFIVKERVIASGEEIGASRGLFQNHCLYISRSESNGVQCNVITIDENGEPHHSVISSGNNRVYLLEGLGGDYFNVQKNEEDETNTIISHTGEELYTYSPSKYDSYSFLDEYNGHLYVNRDDESFNSIFDLKKNEMIWEEDGSEKRVYLPIIKHTVGSKDGFYTAPAAYINPTEHEIYYYSTKDNDVQAADNTTLVSNLECSRTYMTIDEEYVNVYRYVEYKGEPTLQKSCYPRIDLGDK